MREYSIYILRQRVVIECGFYKCWQRWNIKSVFVVTLFFYVTLRVYSTTYTWKIILGPLYFAKDDCFLIFSKQKSRHSLVRNSIKWRTWRPNDFFGELIRHAYNTICMSSSRVFEETDGAIIPSPKQLFCWYSIFLALFYCITKWKIIIHFKL